MSDDLLDQVRHHMIGMSTPELKAIVRGAESSEYTPKALAIAQEILSKRGSVASELPAMPLDAVSGESDDTRSSDSGGLSPGQRLYQEVSEATGSSDVSDNLAYLAAVLQSQQRRASQPPIGAVLFRLVIVGMLLFLGTRGVFRVLLGGQATGIDILAAGTLAFIVVQYLRRARITGG